MPGADAAGTAVVCGGSLAGLLAARVLAERYPRVVVLERGQVPHGPEFRSGVPHSRHVHQVLRRGVEALESLLPGIVDDLCGAGALRVELGHDILTLGPAGPVPRFRSGLATVCCRRELLEWVVRRRVLQAAPSIQVIQEARVAGYLAHGAGGIAGVRARRRIGDGERAEEHPAELVVDATGARSGSVEWLAAATGAAPREDVFQAELAYASRLYAREPDPARDWTGLFVPTAPPAFRRGGSLFAVDGDRWLVTLTGVGGDAPPTDEEGFLAFARSLANPALHERIAGARPESRIWGYRQSATRWRRYDLLRPFPAGLVVLGDAVASMNPVYGHGMTLAALGAQHLAAWLREGGRGQGGLALHERLARDVRRAWTLVTAQDALVPGAAGPPETRGARAMRGYLQRVNRLAGRSAAMHEAFARVAHLLDPPSSLVRPAVLGRVVGDAVRRV